MISFTIVTITYNAESLFPKTAQSVLEQTYPCVEHLIIDGASQDGTMSLVHDYEQRNREAGNCHCVVSVSEPDKGIYDAMNKGLARATGDYVCFLNAGDFLPSASTLENLASKVKAGEPMPAVLYGDTDIVDGNFQFLRHRRLSPPENLTWHSFKRGMLVCHQAFYARVDLAREIPYDTNYRFSADVDWCIRVMKEAERRGLSLVYAQAVVANYLEEGQTTRNHKASLKERFHVMRKHYGLFQTLLLHAWFVLRAVIRK